MADLRGFDARTVNPTVGFEPIPAGDYLVVITESEMKQNRNTPGSHLALTFEVIEGEYKGRKLFTNLNLDNPNRQAVKIARAELSAICRAVGVMTPKDSMELHNLPMRVRVGLEKRQDTGELQNRIKKYEPKGAGVQQPVSAQTDTPPWRRPN